MSQQVNTHKTAYLTLGMMMGASIGAVAGLLTAPRSGKETRALVRSQTMNARDRAIDKTNNLKAKPKNLVNSAANKVKEFTSRTKLEADNQLPPANS